MRILFALVALTSLSGCFTVAPYQREHLANPTMNVEHEEGESGFQAHVFDSREGATGGLGSTGGGCGCN